MNRSQKLYILALMACLAASPRVLSQTVSGNATTGASSAGQSGQVAPSEDVPSSGMALRGDQPTSKTGTRKAAGAGNLRGSLSIGAIPGEPPHLCFQPGIGWQPVTMHAFGDTDKSNALDTPEIGASGKVETKSSVTGGNSRSVYARPSGTEQTMSIDCPGMLPNAMAPRAAMEDMTIGKRPKAGLPFRSTNKNAGAQDWLQANSVLNPASSAASQRLLMGLNTMPTGVTHGSTRTRSGASAAQINSLKTHAYISSIKLRKMMRNAPDLQTRIKLQELQDRLAKQSHNPTGNAKENNSRKEQLKNRHGNMDHSSRKPSHNDHVTDITSALSSHTYPY